MMRFPPLNVVQITHVSRNDTNREVLADLITAFAIVFQLQLENVWSCTIRSHGDNNKSPKKITKMLEKFQNRLRKLFPFLGVAP